MKIASVADVKARFSSFLRESKKGPVIVTRNGKPVGVLLPMEDEEEIERLLLAYSPPITEDSGFGQTSNSDQWWYLS